MNHLGKYSDLLKNNKKIKLEEIIKDKFIDETIKKSFIYNFDFMKASVSDNENLNSDEFKLYDENNLIVPQINPVQIEENKEETNENSPKNSQKNQNNSNYSQNIE